MAKGGSNLPTRIETGDTSVTDKWTVIRIILLFIFGACLIGTGVGYLIGICH